ncbi:MAG TPA: glycosyltransferase family 1 protein, partial [Chloroflexota bacterium]|nr:glycosyltransferase family 1 protein [Chloroflexota bacterium]
MSAPTPRPLRLGCVMEQVLGHVSWSQQLERALAGRAGVETRVVKTALYRDGGLPERLPLPSYVQGGLRGLLDTRAGLRGWRPDVLLFNTQKPAIFCQPTLLRTPTLLMTDVTPRDYDAMASDYEHRPDRGPITRLKHVVNALNFRLAAAVVPWSRWAARSLVNDYGVPAE